MCLTEKLPISGPQCAFPVPQEAVGFDTFPTPIGSLQYEGEEHQESPDSHPENQSESSASWEEGRSAFSCPFVLIWDLFYGPQPND